MIRQELAKWQETTDSLMEVLNSDGEREAIIDHLVDLLAEREGLKTAIQAPFTPEEELLGLELVSHEMQLTLMMNQMQTQIKNDIAQTRKKKRSLSSYIDPFKDLLPDGTFYDEKK